MKAGVTVMRKLSQYDASPGGVLQPVSMVLDRHPQIELASLSWRMSATDPAAPDMPAADTPAQIISINGYLTGFAHDYRAALNYLENFQGDLAAQGYQVTILSKPLDVSPSGSIADQREMEENALGFSLRISRRPLS